MDINEITFSFVDLHITGATSLFVAAQEGHVEVVQQLLKAGADVEKARQGGATPLYIAAQNGHVEVVQQLLKAGAEVDKARQTGATPLYIAAQNGHVEVVQQLLKAGAEVDKAKQDGATPLLIAAEEGHVEVVQQLLKAGAEVDKAKQDGATPLFIAAQEGHVEVVQQLLKAGAEVDKAKKSGVTPLYIATKEGYVEIVQQLLKAGADMGKTIQLEEPTQQRTDLTPLHFAAESGDLNTVNVLVSAGADATCPVIIKNKETEQVKEQSPYDVAVERCHNLVAYTLWSASRKRTDRNQSSPEFPTELSAHRTTIERRLHTEKTIIRTIITTVLSEHVGRRWRELGRRLGLTEVDLDDVQYRCDRDRAGLKEMSVRSLLMWLDRQLDWPNIFDVWWALQGMQMADVADLVEKKLIDERNRAGVKAKDEVKENREERTLEEESVEATAAAAPATKSFIKGFEEVSISSPGSTFSFDAFVSANQRDFSWVNEWVQQLESPPHNLKICVHHRDFKTGVPITDNIAWAVANSRKILVVLSKNFLTSNWCKVELRAAIEKAMRNDEHCVLPILKSECVIPTELAHLTYMDCTDGTVDVTKLASDIKTIMKKR
ncbi:uncharacterized protein LOC144861671 [Branchiostoma floridae x Branchiostoma japonicum]